jgi:hypothetical protein
VQVRRVLVLSMTLMISHAVHADEPYKSTESTRSPESLLEFGRVEYERGDYSAAVHTLVPLLYPSVALGSEDAVVEAHRLLALSYLLQKKELEAEEEATSLFALRPSFRLDPIVDPPMAVSFFETVRTRQSARLTELHAREVKDAEARAKETERKRRASAERIIIERTIEHHSRLLATVPFGVGQFQNGQMTKAALFLSGELVFGAASLAGYLALQEKFPVDGSSNHRFVPAGQESTAHALLGLQLGAGIAFWATLAWGLIDAHVLFRREVVKTRELTQPPKGVTIGPGGLGLQGAF